MAHDVEYLLHRAETEAIRAIGCDSAGVAAVHQEMCLLYTGQAIAQLLAAGFGQPWRGALRDLGG
jgi:hypothetical protein